MVSNGQEFRLSIPPKNKFIVGQTTYHSANANKNSLENLRPQHIMEALLVSPIDTVKEKYFVEETETSEGLYYVLTLVESDLSGEMDLRRKIWFDRANLNISRVELYGAAGSLVEDVHYTNYQDFQGISYPAEIAVHRPREGYWLSITIQKARFNEPIPPEKFELNKPPNAQLIELGGAH
jgi:outer membrane lipoprotein-sorting protein